MLKLIILLFLFILSPLSVKAKIMQATVTNTDYSEMGTCNAAIEQAKSLADCSDENGKVFTDSFKVLVSPSNGVLPCDCFQTMNPYKQTTVTCTAQIYYECEK